MNFRLVFLWLDLIDHLVFIESNMRYSNIDLESFQIYLFSLEEN